MTTPDDSSPAGISLILIVETATPSLDPTLRRWVGELRRLNRPCELIIVPQSKINLVDPPDIVRILPAPEPWGFGTALKVGIESSVYPLICYSSTDYPYEPKDLRVLLKRLEEPDAETGETLHLVTGHRTGQHTPWWARAAGWLSRRFWNTLLDLDIQPQPGWIGLRAKGYTRLNRFLFGTRVNDINSAFKIIRREVLDKFPIQSKGEFVHAEILAKANFLGCYFDELPLTPKKEQDSPTPSIGRDLWTVLANPRFHYARPLIRASQLEPVESTRNNTMTQIIDAHQHFWNRDDSRFDYSFLEAEPLAPIRRTFLPDDLKPLIEEKGVQKTVLVQTQHTLEENRWALELAEQNDFIAGVVGWVDLASESCEDQLAEFKDHPKFVGIRHITQDEPDDDFIIREEVLRGLKVLEKHRVPFDILFYVKHIHHAVTLAQRLPDLPMVINHLSKPQIKEHRLDNWLEHFQAAARYPNMYCKLSGMITEADWGHWTAEDLKPYVQAALEAFGPDRLMFGSDWPVCLLAGSYAQVFDALNEALGPISDEDRTKIFGGTAIKFYGLRV